MQRGEWIRSVVRVGDGRGFIVETDDEKRLIITAGHCLPHLPRCHPASYTHERTYKSLIGPTGAEPTVWGECLFVDPVADLAVIGRPVGQQLWNQCEAYDALQATRLPLPIGKGPVTRYGTSFLGPTEAKSDAWLLSLDGTWFSCQLRSRGRALWIKEAAEPIRGGMADRPS
jgi:hypothetical protein